MMMEHLGQPGAAGMIMTAIEIVLKEKVAHTPDMGGTDTEVLPIHRTTFCYFLIDYYHDSLVKLILNFQLNQWS